MGCVKNYVDMALLEKCDLKVLIDSMYGAGGHYFEGILKGTGCKAQTINAEHDVNFGGINPEPIARNLKKLMVRVKEEHFDIGIATDGDVDRVGCVSPDGIAVNGQNIMALLLWHFVEDRKMKGAVVTTVCGTVLLRKICEKYRLKLYETAVGFKYICDLMRKEDVLIGGEETGGIGFKDYIPERDGILSGLLLLEMMACRKKSFPEILNDMQREFGSYYYLRANVRYPAEKKAKMEDTLMKTRLSDILGEKVVATNTKDGIKYLCEDSSWMLFRMSGTEPKLRVYSEAATEAKAKEMLDFGKNLVSKI